MGNCSTLEQMTKQQLVEAVSVKTGREQAEVENVLEAVLGSIADALTSNERVDLRGFGSFAVKDKKERQGRNPRTGETITIAAKRNASFKPGKELSEKLILPRTEANPA
jgi:nucleoid DNA-binding protein